MSLPLTKQQLAAAMLLATTCEQKAAKALARYQQATKAVWQHAWYKQAIISTTMARRLRDTIAADERHHA